MPPIIFVAGAASTWNAGAGSLSIATPAAVKPGDLLLMVLCFHVGAYPLLTVDGLADVVAAGWEQSTTVLSANTVVVLRRTVTDSEPANHTATFTAAVQGQAALVAFRGADPLAAMDAVAAVNSVATTNHLCPSKVLAAYSSLYLGIVMLAGAFGPPPVGTTMVLAVNDGTNSIAIFTKRPDVAGATGTQTLTTGAARTGVAASFMIDAPATLGPVGFSLSPVGSIGLPTVGV